RRLRGAVPRGGGEAMTKQRVLIVDDNADLADNMAEIVADAGFEADSFVHARAALAAFAPGRYAAALLDIRMPDIDGVELYRALREKDPALPAIAMTGYVNDERLREAVEAGMLAVLAKPVQIPVLLARLTSVATGETALVVEDDTALAQNLAEILADRGFSARIAHTCAEAQRIIAAAPIALALVDWRLPDGDGVSLVERSLAESGCTNVLYTGFPDEIGSARTRAETAGAHFFSKPLPIEQLLTLAESAKGSR
ncbi:MAG: response regulator, partial [Polyangiaceae bacterium]